MQTGTVHYITLNWIHWQNTLNYILSTNLRAIMPRPNVCIRRAVRCSLMYRCLASQPRTIFCISRPHARRQSDRSRSMYATSPARKKIFVLPNWNLSLSYNGIMSATVRIYLCFVLLHSTVSQS